ncbi:MAG: DUF1844 domain-containing protein [Atribacterota bacterium]
MEEERKEKDHKKTEPGKIKDLGYYFLNVLSAKAWSYMGLIAHPENNEFRIDLEECRKAIDLYSAIFEYLRSELSPEEKKELEIHLANMQLNYVEKTKKPS